MFRACIFAILLLAFSLHSITFLAYAQQIVPTNVDSAGPLAASWFIASINPGQSKTFTASVQNNQRRQMELQIIAKDSMATSDGVFTYIPTEQENKNAGSWISLASQSVSLSPNASQNVDFTVTVPPQTPAGEYAAVVAVQEKSGQNDGSPLLIQQRIGARVYITVGGDLAASAVVEASNPFLPGKDGYDDFVKSYFQQPFDFAFTRFLIKNSGNVFGKFTGQITLSTAGQDYVYNFDRDFSPRESAALLAIDFRTNEGLPVVWKAGTYTVSYQFEGKPLISSNKNTVATQAAKGGYEFEVTQEMLDTMKADFEKYRTQREDQITAGKEAGSELTITDLRQSEEEKQDIPAWWYVAGGAAISVVVLAVIAGVVWFLKKHQKAKKV